MTLWIVWSMLVSALLAVAAIAAERWAIHVRAPRRFVWLSTMALVTLAPLVFALQSAPAPLPPASFVASATTPASNGLSRNAVVQRSPAMPPFAIQLRASSGQPPVEASPVFDAMGSVRRALANGQRLSRNADPWVERAWLLSSLILLALFGRSLLALRTLRSRWRETETELGRVLVAQKMLDRRSWASFDHALSFPLGRSHSRRPTARCSFDTRPNMSALATHALFSDRNSCESSFLGTPLCGG